MHFSALAQRILESLYSAAALTRPKAKNDLSKVHHVAVADGAGSLAPGKLQLDDSIHLVERGLNPLRLFKACVGNNGPTGFTIFQQPFHRPLINSARSTDKPRSTLRNKWRQVLLEQ